ncbi:MAG: hypothetical protein JWQ98_2873 [Chlorobi bacterium]|nr:hypothetical protein [Chlorobiota bacterium]
MYLKDISAFLFGQILPENETALNIRMERRKDKSNVRS